MAASVEVDGQKAEDCLNKTGFSDRMPDMPRGLDTPLYRDFESDGVEISGGEAQKIALARALYKDAPFVILDEPTAALDPVAEYEIYSGFETLVGSKSAVYISHRLSSCRFCDDIAVFEQGQLVQRGDHETLLAQREGLYQELWNAQAQYYEDNTEESEKYSIDPVMEGLNTYGIPSVPTPPPLPPSFSQPAWPCPPLWGSTLQGSLEGTLPLG